MLGLGLELDLFCTSIVFYEIIQFNIATVVVHVNLACIGTTPYTHSRPCKRPVFVNPPNSLIRHIFRKRIMAD